MAPLVQRCQPKLDPTLALLLHVRHVHRELVSRLLQRQSLNQPQDAGKPPYPQRSTLSIGQHQAFHGSDFCNNPRLNLLMMSDLVGLIGLLRIMRFTILPRTSRRGLGD